MSRREFPARIKAAAALRAAGNCERCTAKTGPGNIEYDHVIPDALGGEPTFENCAVLCRSCHRFITAKEDVPTIARAKRINRKHLNATAPRKRKMPYRKFSGQIVWGDRP